MSWESPQTLPALFDWFFDYVEWFQNLKFAVITNKDHKHSEYCSKLSSEGTAAIHLDFK